MRSRGVLVLGLLGLVAVLGFASGESEVGSETAVPVKLWVPGGAQDDQAAVNEAAREYAGSRIGAYPELEFFGWDVWADRKALAIQSGEDTDIMFTAAWNSYYEEVVRNAWIPLDDLIDEHAPILYEVVGNFLKGPVLNGQIYAVPTVKEGADSAQFLLNGELCEKYGIPYTEIRSPEQLAPYLALIKENEPDVIPYIIDPDVSDLAASPLRNTWNNIGAGRLFWWFEDTQEVQFIFHREEAWRAVDMTRDWYLAGYFQPEIEDVGGESAHNRYMSNGNFFAYSQTAHPGKAGEMSVAFGREIVGTGPLQQSLVTTEILLGSMLAISRACEHPVEAINIIEMMNTDRYFNNLLNFGIEGRHYEFVSEEEGVIDAIPDTGYAPNMQWALQNQFLTYLYSSENPNKWELYQEFNESARVSPVVGFAADLSGIRTQMASIAVVEEQYRPLLIRGLVDPDDIREEYLSALSAAGVEEVEAELTRQVREFLANQ